MATDFEGLTDAQLEARRRELLDRLDEFQEFTPGSFQEEFKRCGKQPCHCQDEGDPGHGPYLSVLRYEAGRSVKMVVPARLGDRMRGRVARWDEFKAACGQIVDYYHARHHVADLADLLAPALDPPGRDDLERRLVDCLDLGDTQALAAIVADLRPTGDLAREAASALAYFTGNHHRMQYGLIRNQSVGLVGIRRFRGAIGRCSG